MDRHRHQTSGRDRFARVLSRTMRRLAVGAIGAVLLASSAPAVLPAAVVRASDAGACPSLVWVGNISSFPGDPALAPIEQKAEAEARQLLGLAGDAPVLTEARGLVRAYMFADLLRIIGEQHENPGSLSQADKNAYDTFAFMVKQERLWVASKANELYNAHQSDPQTIAAVLWAGAAGLLGIPGIKEPPDPTAKDYLTEATGRAFNGGWTTLSGPIQTQAQGDAIAGLKVLAAVGRGPLIPGDAPSGEEAFGPEFWHGVVGGLTEAFQVNLSSALKAGLGGLEGGKLGASYVLGVLMALANSTWKIVDTVGTVDNLNANLDRAKQAPNLDEAMNDATGFRELFSVFMAMTLQDPNSPVDPNNSDCAARNALRRPSPSPAPASTDPVFWVTGAGASQAVLGGSSGDHAVMDWSYSRHTGPVSSRQTAAHYVQHIYVENTGAPTGGTWTLTVNAPPAPPGYVPTPSQFNPYAPRTTEALPANATGDQIVQAIVGMFTDYPDIAVVVQKEGSGAPTGYPPSSGDQTPAFVGYAPPREWYLAFYGDTGTWLPHVTAVTTKSAADGGICLNVAFGICSRDKPEDILRLDTLWTPTDASDGGLALGATTLWPNVFPAGGECQAVGFSGGVFVERYVPPTGACGGPPVDNSWGQSASLRYVDAQGNFWTAWKVAGNKLLNIEDAIRVGGTATVYPQRVPNPGIDAVTGACEVTPRLDFAPFDQAGLCIVGSSTSFSSDFAAGDQIMLQSTSNGPTGGITSVIRTVTAIVDDTHLQLESSATCPLVSDGTDCLVGTEGPFMPFNHEFVDPQYTSPTTTPNILSGGTNNGPFTILRLAHNDGLSGGCPTWRRFIEPLPVAPCYYSDTLRFRDQAGAMVDAALAAQGSPAPQLTLAVQPDAGGPYNVNGPANTTVKLNDPLGPGTWMGITLKAQASGTVSISQIPPPSGTPVPAGTMVVGAFEVTLYRGLTDASIDGVTIRFTTSSSLSTAALERLSNGTWTLLPARLISTAGGVSTWEVTSPGFSTYAIVGAPGTNGTAGKLALCWGPTIVCPTTPPSPNTGGTPLSVQPTIRVEDADGNTVASDNSTVVTLSIAPGTPTSGGPGTLSCTGGNSRTVTAGVATFTGCSIDNAGTGYQVVATSVPALASATSATFNVVAGPAAKAVTLTLTPSSHVITWGGTANLTMTMTPNGSGKTVQLQVSRDNATWSTLTTLTLDTSGTATFPYRPSDNRYYRASFAGSTDAAAGVSPSVRVVVRQISLLRPTNGGHVRSISRGTSVVFTTTIRPNRPDLPQGHANFVVYQLVNGHWTPIESRTIAVNTAGAATLTVTFNSRGQFYVRSQSIPTPLNANSGWSTPVERYIVV